MVHKRPAFEKRPPAGAIRSKLNKFIMNLPLSGRKDLIYALSAAILDRSGNILANNWPLDIEVRTIFGEEFRRVQTGQIDRPPCPTKGAAQA